MPVITSTLHPTEIIILHSHIYSYLTNNNTPYTPLYHLHTTPISYSYQSAITNSHNATPFYYFPLHSNHDNNINFTPQQIYLLITLHQSSIPTNQLPHYSKNNSPPYHFTLHSNPHNRINFSTLNE